jgi:hypothetical protein
MKIARNLLAIAVMLVGASAYPQSASQNPWTVNVPFNFTVRHTNLPAGKYTVKQFGSVIMVTSQSGKTANVLTNRNYITKQAERSSLTFQVNGGTYDLIQVRNMGSNVELEALVNRHAPRQLDASNGASTVEVAAIGTR